MESEWLTLRTTLKAQGGGATDRTLLVCAARGLATEAEVHIELVGPTERFASAELEDGEVVGERRRGERGEGALPRHGGLPCWGHSGWARAERGRWGHLPIDPGRSRVAYFL